MAETSHVSGNGSGPLKQWSAVARLGTTLRQQRLDARLTQEQLAERAGLSARAVSDIERGRVRNPRPESVRLLGGALGLTGPELVRFQALARAEYWTARQDGGSHGENGQGGPYRPEGEPAADPARATGQPLGVTSWQGFAKIPAQLPLDVGGFIGRDRELAELDGLLNAAAGATSAAIAVIAGTAGVGKTALAVHWAHLVARRFGDGQLFLDLRGYDPHQPLSAGEALAVLLRDLGDRGLDIPEGVDARACRYRSLLARRQVLVVMDNALNAEQVRPLLPGAGSSFVVVTSRDGLAGLVARHGASRIRLDLLSPANAAALLRVLIRERVTAEPDAVTDLVRHCAQLPLALRVVAELAAARPTRALTALAAELADEHRRLDLLDAGGDPRTAVRTVFSWSYRHLETEAAHLLQLLGRCSGPSSDVFALAALAGADVDHIRRLLDKLVHVHLIQETSPGRYALHDLLRIYLAEQARRDTSEPGSSPP